MTRQNLCYVLLAAALCSCGGKKTDAPASESVDSIAAQPASLPAAVPAKLKLTEGKYKKSDKHCEVSIKVEAPAGDDVVSGNIRKALLDALDKALSFEGGTRIISPYKDAAPEVKAAVGYYGAEAYKLLKASSVEDHTVRVVTAKEMAIEQGVEFEMPDVMQYQIDVEIEKEYETEKYCVFSLDHYVYSGGAHGSSLGVGGMTFCKSDGKRFTSFLKPSVVKQLQPLLRKGLVSYFSGQDENVTEATLGNMLQIEGSLIPLPADTPYPSEKGLVFRYGQYEIACYAAGKPEFCIPYSKIKPYLTSEAIALLGL